MRAAAYLRVSSTGQRDRATIDGQRRDVPAYIASQGWTLASIYEDDGMSAWTGKLGARLGYARLIADARAGRIDVVVVAAVDRLTRSEDPAERAEIVGRLTRAGVKIAVVGAGIQDPRSLAGDLYLSIMGVLAAAESRIKSERTIAGHITSISRGRLPHGVAPFGLAYSDGSWSLDGDRATVAREVFERVAAGHRVVGLGLELEARGVTRPRGGRWSAKAIRDLIGNDAYLGRWTIDEPRGLVLAVPPIVDEELALVARAVMAARYRRPRARVRHPTLLAGLATCGLCRARVGVGTYTERGAGIVAGIAYRCSHRRLPPAGQDRCALPLHSAEATDERVWAELVDVLAVPAVVDRLLAISPASVDPQPIRAELARLGMAQESILAQLARGDVDQAVADAQVARLAERRRAAQAALGDAIAAASGLRVAADRHRVAEAIDAIRADATTTPIEERRDLLEAVTSAVVIRPEMVGLDLNCSAGHGARSVLTARPFVRQQIRVLAPARETPAHRKRRTA